MADSHLVTIPTLSTAIRSISYRSALHFTIGWSCANGMLLEAPPSSYALARFPYAFDDFQVHGKSRFTGALRYHASSRATFHSLPAPPPPTKCMRMPHTATVPPLDLPKINRGKSYARKQCGKNFSSVSHARPKLKSGSSLIDLIPRQSIVTLEQL